MKVWENSKKIWKHSPVAHVPTAFLVLPNFHLYFYNSIETQAHVFYFLNKNCFSLGSYISPVDNPKTPEFQSTKFLRGTTTEQPHKKIAMASVLFCKIQERLFVILNFNMSKNTSGDSNFWFALAKPLFKERGKRN